MTEVVIINGESLNVTITGSLVNVTINYAAQGNNVVQEERKTLILQKLWMQNFTQIAGTLTNANYSISELGGNAFAISILGYPDFIPTVQVSSGSIPESGVQHTVQDNVINVYLPNIPGAHHMIFIELIRKI